MPLRGRARDGGSGRTPGAPGCAASWGLRGSCPWLCAGPGHTGLRGPRGPPQPRGGRHCQWGEAPRGTHWALPPRSGAHFPGYVPERRSRAGPRPALGTLWETGRQRPTRLGLPRGPQGSMSAEAAGVRTTDRAGGAVVSAVRAEPPARCPRGVVLVPAGHEATPALVWSQDRPLGGGCPQGAGPRGARTQVGRVGSASPQEFTFPCPPLRAVPSVCPPPTHRRGGGAVRGRGAKEAVSSRSHHCGQACPSLAKGLG